MEVSRPTFDRPDAILVLGTTWGSSQSCHAILLVRTVCEITDLVLYALSQILINLGKLNALLVFSAREMQEKTCEQTEWHGDRYNLMSS